MNPERRHLIGPRAVAALVAAALVGSAVLAGWVLVGSGTVGKATALRTRASATAAAGAAQPAALPRTFGWPVRPFHREHALRATFGEPRGLIDLGLRLRGAARAVALNRMDQVALIGHRSLHTGVDIVAPDGTPVYAVTSGTATAGGAGFEQHVAVGPFQYWHLADPVPTGTPVVAYRTVIGRVYPGQEHVHLTRLGLDGTPLNPLVDGGLTPYSDTTPPRLGRLRAYRPDGTRVSLHRLSGPVVLAVNAFDPQSFGGLETGLYRLDWAMRRIGTGGPRLGPLELFRFDRLPPDAVGQRLYTIGSTRHRTHPHFSYRLTSVSAGAPGPLHADELQTELMPAGRYELVVVAWDVRGNHARRSYDVRILPSGGALVRPPGAPPAGSARSA